MNKQQEKRENWIEYYDHKSILNEITDEPVDLRLDEHLRKDILSGKRRRKLKNITLNLAHSGGLGKF